MRHFEFGAIRAKQHAAASAMVAAALFKGPRASDGHAALRKRVRNVERDVRWEHVTREFDLNRLAIRVHGGNSLQLADGNSHPFKFINQLAAGVEQRHFQIAGTVTNVSLN
jgi:hypothetical protein